jgi:hypothetical protein
VNRVRSFNHGKNFFYRKGSVFIFLPSTSMMRNVLRAAYCFNTTQFHGKTNWDSSVDRRRRSATRPTLFPEQILSRVSRLTLHVDLGGHLPCSPHASPDLVLLMVTSTPRIPLVIPFYLQSVPTHSEN